jgi:hypothetical protein
MDKLAKMGAGSLLAAVAIAGGVAMAGTAGAATAPQVASARSALATCAAQHHKFPFPKAATQYQAGAAGAVTVAPVNAGTIKVVKASPVTGYRARVDTRQGSSVDVYFTSSTHRVKFEAEINNSGGLTITVTTC